MTTALTAKERTLVGIGAAVASGCQPCTAKYIEAARSAGACERSIRLAVETALAERVKATESMAEWALSVQGTVPTVDDSFRTDKQRNTALIATVAAHAVRSASTVGANLSRAIELGWSTAQIDQALDLGRSVSNVAAEKVEGILRESNGRSECKTDAGCAEPADGRARPAGNTPGCGCAGGCQSA